MSQEEYEQFRERSRSRSRGRESEDGYEREGRESRFEQQDNSAENFSLHVSNLSTEVATFLIYSFTSPATTDDALKAAFERFGSVQSSTIIKEPITKHSRGFAFVTMERVEDSIRALAEMNNSQFDGKTIRVEKAKRKEAYEKTPGVYLGPPQLSSKYRREREDRERGGSHRDRERGRDRDRERSRDNYRRDSRERYHDSRDLYDRYPSYRLPPPHLYDRVPLIRDDRFDPRVDYRRDIRYDPRDMRAVPPLLTTPLYDFRRSPPRSDYRGRSPLNDRRVERRRSSSRN